MLNFFQNYFPLLTILTSKRLKSSIAQNTWELEMD
jgi:hypothetical protein